MRQCHWSLFSTYCRYTNKIAIIIIIKCSNTLSVLMPYYLLLQLPQQRKLITTVMHFCVHGWIISADISINCAVFTKCVAVNQYKLIDFMQQHTFMDYKRTLSKMQQILWAACTLPWPGRAYTTPPDLTGVEEAALCSFLPKITTTLTFRPHNLPLCTLYNFP